ncbi:hypothetical protein [Streptomyces sp. H27-C3]|uniref:hypothetical protein n=1 Tax=Streptomyces sp. H27-C3 TaxID=3046305 RepID=UPI0024B8DB80|nr:hypothetical protein [Streptomyces sp. H27-C3]MDJ0464425.1 hypothetical protein [Streptomyces sp. H27-C3]
MADSDPIPGDPDQMAALGKQLRKTADELERQIKNLRAVVDVDAWDSDAGKEFREKSKGSVKKLEAAFKRYNTAAGAIGSEVQEVAGSHQDKLLAPPNNYASDLNRAQEMADAALKDAQDADTRKGAAEKSLDGLSGKKGNEDKEGFEDKKKAATGEIESAKAKIGEAKRIRDDAAKRARESIDDVISHDSLKDGFWDTLVKSIADVTQMISTWCGILSLVVGWIPVIGQALAGVLGAVAMIATLINTLATLVQVLQGNAEWMDLGMAALGFVMMGVGKAFSKVAGKFADKALKRIDLAKTAKTSRQIGRNNKKFNQISGKKNRLDRTDAWKSLKEPFTEPFSKGAWSKNLQALRPGNGNYDSAWSATAARGEGNAAVGAGKSFSMVDAGVASKLKDIKLAAPEMGDFPAVNKISSTATKMSLFGGGVTLGGLALDSNLNPLLG